MLKDYNDCYVKVASNGLEAVEIATSWIPDIILMDINMHIMDGIEATREIITRLHAKPCIIGLTAFASTRGQDLIKAGASFILQKPISKQSLIESLQLCETI